MGCVSLDVSPNGESLVTVAMDGNMGIHSTLRKSQQFSAPPPSASFGAFSSPNVSTRLFKTRLHTFRIRQLDQGIRSGPRLPYPPPRPGVRGKPLRLIRHVHSFRSERTFNESAAGSEFDARRSNSSDNLHPPSTFSTAALHCTLCMILGIIPGARCSA